VKGLRALRDRFLRELAVYRRVLRHPRTPRPARWLLAAAVGYALLPFDLVPDWIPVLGQLDDLVLVPLLVWLALRRLPEEVLAECRREEHGGPHGGGEGLGGGPGGVEPGPEQGYRNAQK